MKQFLHINIIVILLVLCSCGSSHDATERRSLMMPNRAEIGVNADHYTEGRYIKRAQKLNKLSKKRFKHLKKQIRRRNKAQKHKFLFW
jgi:hypothetical protein